MKQKLPPLLRFAIVGRDTEKLSAWLCATVPGVKIVQSNPDAVVSWGGDGTILKSEHLYPGVPKLCTRDCAECASCGKSRHMSREAAAGSGKWVCLNCLEPVFRRAVLGEYSLREEIKLEGIASMSGRPFRVEALNEVQLHNSDPSEAIRFEVVLNGKTVAKNCISDGLVVSTPYGATGYFHSITGKSFREGVGVAFNNPTVPHSPIIIGKSGDFELRGKLLRGDALFLGDNNPAVAHLRPGDGFFVRLSKRPARFVA